MTRIVLLSLLALLALPAAATAAPVKISPRVVTVSEAGAASVEVANPNRYALRGKASLVVRGRIVAARSVRLAKRAVGVVKLRLDGAAVAALREAGGRATLKLRLRRPGGRKATARRKLTLKLPQAPAPPAPGPGHGPGPGGGPAPASGGSPAPPATPHRWVGRMGTSGPYDDLELTLTGNQIQITRPPFVPVACFENGGYYRHALSFELFDASGPWTIGTDATVAKQGIAVNQLVYSGARTINYKVTGTSLQPGRLAGTLGMSFFESKYDVPTGGIYFVNCSGSQSFEAIPAG
jgi:hypothetical protein